MTFKQNNDLSFNKVTIFGYFILIQFLLILIDLVFKISVEQEYTKKLYSVMLTHITITNILWFSSIYLLFKNKINIIGFSIIYLLGLSLADYDYVFLGTIHESFVKFGLYPSFLEEKNGTGYDYNYAKFFIMILTTFIFGLRTFIGKLEKQRLFVFVGLCSIIMGNILFNNINKMVIQDIKDESRIANKTKIDFVSKAPGTVFLKLCNELDLTCVTGNINQNNENKTGNEIADRNIKFVIESLKSRETIGGGFISSNYNNNPYSGFVEKLQNGDYRIIMKVDDLQKNIEKWDFWKSASLVLYNLFVFTFCMFMISPDYKKTFKDLIKSS